MGIAPWGAVRYAIVSVLEGLVGTKRVQVLDHIAVLGCLERLGCSLTPQLCDLGQMI